MLFVMLSNRGNPDHGEDPRRPVAGGKDRMVPVADLEAASAACRQYIKAHGLGGGNWTGGEVRDMDGTVVAEVSYNGRIWPKE